MYSVYELDTILDSVQKRPGYNNSDVVEIFEFVNKNLSLFEDGSFYNDEDEIYKLIHPCFLRLYGKFFITPPTLLKDEKLELFKLSFDKDEFLIYLLEMIPKVKMSLEHFDSLDRTNETLSLLVDNYVARVFNKVYNCDDCIMEIRNFKLKKTLE